MARLVDFLRPELCVMDLKAKNKEQAIRELADVLEKNGKIKDKADFIKHVLEREQLGSTGIGNRVAIPHAPTHSVDGIALCFGRSLEGIDFQSLDGQEVNAIFLIGTCPSDISTYLKILASLAQLVNQRQFLEEFLHASTVQELISVLKKFELGHKK
ncbi:MAG: PTS sugar transporter subunit IIA [Candidatus Omnitrophica bacterium]|nr:PTS sugar transporter subunit IIA [Candidatus Omnitrophota bacterium]